MDSLERNGTYTLVPLPKGSVALPSKWVFDVKTTSDGKLDRHKARLVALGCRQIEGVDYQEVFSPVSKATTLRALCAMIATPGWYAHHLDVKTAFLNGVVEELVYVRQPEGFVDSDSPHLVWQLHKALYGLKQAPRAWHKALTQVLSRLGFDTAVSDPALFLLGSEATQVVLLAYVDDFLIAGPSQSHVLTVRDSISSTFECRDLGEVKQFISWRIDLAPGQVTISQPKLVAQLLQAFPDLPTTPASTPMSTSVKLTKDKDSPALHPDAFPYSSVVGTLIYLAISTRPDIMFAVNTLARYMARPTALHWKALLHLLRYLQGTPNLGIMYKAAPSEFTAYSDASFASDLDSRRSVTAWVFSINGAPVSWNSQLQKTVATSTAESEYMAASSAVKEALWISKLYADLGMHAPVPTIRCDNQATLAMVKNPVISERSKHIDTVHHFMRERVARQQVAFSFVPTKEQHADILTKPLSKEVFTTLRDHLGMQPVYEGIPLPVGPLDPDLL